MALDDKTLDSITEIGTGGKRRLIPIKVVRWLQNDNHQEFITLQKSGIHATTKLCFLPFQQTSICPLCMAEFLAKKAQKLKGQMRLSKFMMF